LIAHVRREEARRREAGTLAEPLPNKLRLAEEQVVDWVGRWARATRDAPLSFDEAQAVATMFLSPVLAGDAEGMRWHSATQTWDATE
jgi:hypothetical protein